MRKVAARQSGGEPLSASPPGLHGLPGMKGEQGNPGPAGKLEQSGDLSQVTSPAFISC